MSNRSFVHVLILICLTLFCASTVLAQSAGDPPVQASAPRPSRWYEAITFNGLISASYVANTDAPASGKNAFRVFDVDSGSFKLDLAELVVQHAISSPGEAGFRVDFTVGSSVPRVTAAWGLFRDESGKAGDFDLQQAYASYIFRAGRGLRLDVGKFTSHIGYEVIEGYDGFNDNHSRGLACGYAQPMTHTGLKATYPFTNSIAAQFLLVNGWDNAIDNNTGKSIGAQLAVNTIPRLSLTANYLGGPEQADDNEDWRHLLDVVLVARLTPVITLAANYNYGREAAVALPETAGGGEAEATWQAVAGYARLTVSPKLALTARGEWFDDPEGARTGYAQTLREVTLTPEFKVHPQFIVRGDLRHDQSNRALFERSDGSFGKGQTTMSVNGIFVF